MIVKNEETLLPRCLDSLSGLADEIIIVDTGSTDNTKAAAARYTDRIYDFPWEEDFSAARNFSFSKASMDYIYAPDADEVLQGENLEKFRLLKETLLPEVEIVQMKYRTTEKYDTVLNSKTELRPKLFKRLRTFSWEDPIHETIRTTPLVYDSDIVIDHMPLSLHHKRDFSIFRKAFEKNGFFSPKINNMYAKELLKNGDQQDFSDAEPIFSSVYDFESRESMRKEASCILARCYRLLSNTNQFFKTVLKEVGSNPSSEICFELGAYFEEVGDFQEASVWYYNSAYETQAILDVHTGGDLPLQGLIRCYEKLLASLSPDDPFACVEESRLESALEEAKNALEAWQLPEE
jgi:glycosyltransferase involved in cell wall biosynthesis